MRERGCAVKRIIATTAGMAAIIGFTGCASTWDDLTSRRFRDKPFDTVFRKEDPVHVLRSNPDGGERARAMLRLEEPLANGRPETEQDEMMQILTTAATSDPSPWVRLAAIDALGRFRDARTADALVAAYHQAEGRPARATPPTPTGPIQPASGGRGESFVNDRLGLSGPQGFSSDQVMNIRGRSLDSLAKKTDPKIVNFLAVVASGKELPADEDPAVKDFVRQRAVAGLGKIRTQESIAALGTVLAAENGKDVTLTHLAHEGLVELTGQKLPPDPEKWGAVVQAGVQVAPESGTIQKAIDIKLP